MPYFPFFFLFFSFSSLSFLSLSRFGLLSKFRNTQGVHGSLDDGDGEQASGCGFVSSEDTVGLPMHDAFSTRSQKMTNDHSFHKESECFDMQ